MNFVQSENWKHCIFHCIYNLASLYINPILDIFVHEIGLPLFRWLIILYV